jgi:carbamoyltransferase
MIMTADVRKQFRVTHVNGSARVQTVTATDSAEFHTLLQAIGKMTGREMVLDTRLILRANPSSTPLGRPLKHFSGRALTRCF